MRIACRASCPVAHSASPPATRATLCHSPRSRSALPFRAGERYAHGVTSRLRTASLVAALVAFGPATSASAADEPADPEDTTEAAQPEDIDPDAGIARPDAPDLRSGHVVIRGGGGLWVPSNPFAPSIDELGSLNLGGAFHGQLGLGLNRYLTLGATGGLALIPSSDTDCGGCGATSIEAGLDLEFHINQGFALDPWVSYGMGYRHSILGLAEQENVTLQAFEFTRIGLGADYFPTGSLGFGPYMQVDVGARDLSDPVFYAIFQLGLRVTFDPMAIGTSFSPGQEQTAARW